ncbi:hypothetical protein SUDANB105_07884 [Streptomyces sp. enrichment culture]|uniref:hypothetical protein n=1 Tax=Streptomyces sp. enrichment culture TaxID=1795815 RepID=UPI003F54FB8C
MPHTTDKRISKELAHLLYLGRLQPKGGRPALDPTDRGQLAFQALLFECLMTTREHPHPLEQPRKSAMASISGYLNVICHQENHLEIHTNMAFRIASRILPLPGKRRPSACDHLGVARRHGQEHSGYRGGCLPPNFASTKVLTREEQSCLLLRYSWARSSMPKSAN